MVTVRTMRKMAMRKKTIIMARNMTMRMERKMTMRIVTMRSTITSARESPRTAIAEDPGALCWDLDRTKIHKYSIQADK